ncbi:MAG: serine hydrolase domain-containing protein [Burkholderiales bacterium]
MQATLANWRSPPFNRWAFHHVRELIPSADIPAEPAAVRRLAPHPAGMPPGFEEFLRDTDTDGIAVVHRGRLVFERYANGMTGATPHILMSVSKSMLGLLADELEQRGELDSERPVADVVPELAGTAYREATIRHLLDMRAAIAWNEDYLANSGPIVEYRKASGWNPVLPGDPPADLHSFFQTLTDAEAHGGRFHYVSPNSDLLGWVIERATGQRYAGLMSELVWKPAGAERDAYITVDRLGAPRCAGGMCVTVRDLARVGLWMIDTGRMHGLETAGSPEAWAAGDLAQYFPGLPMRYRSQWYALDANRDEKAAPLVFGFGIHGQNLFVDRANEIVVAKVSSQALPLDAARIGPTLRAVAELRKFLA